MTNPVPLSKQVLTQIWPDRCCSVGAGSRGRARPRLVALVERVCVLSQRPANES